MIVNISLPELNNAMKVVLCSNPGDLMWPIKGTVHLQIPHCKSIFYLIYIVLKHIVSLIIL
jgi:hypothetical protein